MRFVSHVDNVLQYMHALQGKFVNPHAYGQT